MYFGVCILFWIYFRLFPLHYIHIFICIILFYWIYFSWKCKIKMNKKYIKYIVINLDIFNKTYFYRFTISWGVFCCLIRTKYILSLSCEKHVLCSLLLIFSMLMQHVKRGHANHIYFFFNIPKMDICLCRRTATIYSCWWTHCGEEVPHQVPSTAGRRRPHSPRSGMLHLCPLRGAVWRWAAGLYIAAIPGMQNHGKEEHFLGGITPRAVGQLVHVPPLRRFSAVPVDILLQDGVTSRQNVPERSLGAQQQAAVRMLFAGPL